MRQALAFFTVLPAPAAGTWTERDLQRALVALPFAGLVIGLLLLAAQALLEPLAREVRGACLTVLWLVLTGALHFDGLCDTADAVFAATSRDERLRIAKDPRLGSYALATGGGILLVKLAALSQPVAGVWLVVVPVLARSAVLPIAALHPNHAASRLGAAARPPIAGGVSAAAAGVIAALAAAALGGTLRAALLATGAALLLAFGMGRLVARRLGGLGGDAYGAIIETLEAALLILAAIGR